MKGLPLFVIGMGLGISALAESAPMKRDPFWPIGYDPAKTATRSVAESPETEAQKPTPEAPTLTDDELRQLALNESERIRQTLKRQATMTTGDRIYAYVQNKWVTTGDTLTVEVQGNTYRLEILTLTSDNIELEAHPTNK